MSPYEQWWFWAWIISIIIGLLIRSFSRYKLIKHLHDQEPALWKEIEPDKSLTQFLLLPTTSWNFKVDERKVLGYFYKIVLTNQDRVQPKTIQKAKNLQRISNINMYMVFLFLVTLVTYWIFLSN